jgi:hypothetical protein
MNADKNWALFYRRLSAFIGGQSTFRIGLAHQVRTLVPRNGALDQRHGRTVERQLPVRGIG